MSGQALSRLVVVVGLLGVMTGTAAAAGWYYKWSCTGRCAPGQLAINGIEGPFVSREECDAFRDRDTRAQYFISEGNLGGLEFCEYLDDRMQWASPTGGGVASGPAPRYRIANTQWGFDFGPGWSTSQAGTSTVASYTLGIDAEAHAGRDSFGGMLLLGFHLSEVATPALGAGDHTYGVVPLLLGIRITPRIAGRAGSEVRLDLAASYGGYMQLACTGCAEGALDEFIGFGYLLKAGVNYFFSETDGFGVHLLATGLRMNDATSGVEVESPPWLLRLAWLQRPKN